MMDYSDRFFRVLMRLLTKRTWLYTEMISSAAIVRGDAAAHLEFDDIEKPVVLQLGGNDEAELARAVDIARPYGYDEINLNAGCPSDRVGRGGFGAYLMAHADKTARLIAAMTQASDIPVTIKCRIGIDGRKIGLPLLEDYAHLREFVQLAREAGAARVCVHARIAVLGGLSPKENREIPPLRYEDVRQLKQEIAPAFVEINGGIRTLAQAREHVRFADAVMIGRAAVNNPYMFARADALHDEIAGGAQGAENFSESFGGRAAAEVENFTENSDISFDARFEVARAFARYLKESMQRVAQNDAAREEKLRARRRALRHLLPLYAGMRGARLWKRRLTEYLSGRHGAYDPEDAVETCIRAMQAAAASST